MYIQGLFPLGLTDLISLQSKGLLRAFSNTTIQKHQFFDAKLSLWSSSHIYTWLLGAILGTKNTEIWEMGQDFLFGMFEL